MCAPFDFGRNHHRRKKFFSIQDCPPALEASPIYNYHEFKDEAGIISPRRRPPTPGRLLLSLPDAMTRTYIPSDFVGSPPLPHPRGHHSSVPPSYLNPSVLWGEHDTETVIIYLTTNGQALLAKVKDFITKPAERPQLKDELHAIRRGSTNDIKFFEIGTGNALLMPNIWFKYPLSQFFTRMDSLDNKAFNQLVREGPSLKTAKEEMPSRVKGIFGRDYYEPLQYMDLPGKDCKVLIETGRALGYEALKLLFLSLQGNSLGLSIKTVINYTPGQCTDSVGQSFHRFRKWVGLTKTGPKFASGENGILSSYLGRNPPLTSTL
ncbi:hypothetical protein JB92DRAFT_3100522 [Gautieria morchelliformis]|nr:hypothetical protein JB92DRAFT_3100522 [Gautieria morchelliformis]